MTPATRPVPPELYAGCPAPQQVTEATVRVYHCGAAAAFKYEVMALDGLYYVSLTDNNDHDPMSSTQYSKGFTTYSAALMHAMKLLIGA